MKRLLLLLVLLSLTSLTEGCAVYKAAHQPDKKDMSVCNVGTRRELVLAEFGNPIYSGKDGDVNYDIFSFVQGYSKGAKTGRALFHGAADIFTLGLWEAVGTPIETAASGSKVRIKVIYDKDNKVASMENLETPDEAKESKENKEMKETSANTAARPEVLHNN